MGGPELHGHHRWRYDRLRPDPAGRGGPAMTALTRPVAQPLPVPQAGPVLDVVVPVYNEEADLDRCDRRLSAHLRATFPYPFPITVADNASTDATLEVARALQRDLPEVSVVHLDEKGRGRALLGQVGEIGHRVKLPSVGFARGGNQHRGGAAQLSQPPPDRGQVDPADVVAGVHLDRVPAVAE